MRATASEHPAIALDEVDVLLLDSELTGEPPVLTDLRSMADQTNVLVPAARTEGSEAFIRAGAKGWIDYHADPAEIVEAVRAVGTGREVAHERSGIGIDLLSPREHAVLSYIARGYIHEQTARRLDISKHTVDTYIRRARAKLHLGNKAELTRAVLNRPVST